MRIAVGGFQHETNTFAPGTTGFDDFERHGTWPELTRGPAILERLGGMNIPLPGFVEACRHDVVPLLWAEAEPGGYVEDDAFDRIVGEIVDGLADSGADALYLDLHGAMATRRHDDAEAEILRRARAVAGEEFPIAASLDLHGNLSRAFFDAATAITAYRTYPHTDLAETGARAARLLDHALAAPLHGAFRQGGCIIPITAQSTEHSPARELYREVAEVDAASADMALGFPPSDVPDCRPSIYAFAESRDAANRAADRLLANLSEAERQFDSRLLPVDDAVAKAMAGSGTTVIADVQDNPGAGGTGDTTGLLRALIEAGARDCVYSMLVDPQAAMAAHSAGTGAELDIELGGGHRQYGEPVRTRVEVEALSDGRFPFSGTMYAGSSAHLGPMARLRLAGAGITVVVGSVRAQNADREMFRVVGIEPAEHAIVCVKSSIHFLADYQPIASQVLFATAPGANPCAPSTIPYRRLRPGLRLGPGGPVFPHRSRLAP